MSKPTDSADMVALLPAPLRRAIDAMTKQEANEVHDYLFHSVYTDTVASLMYATKARIMRRDRSAKKEPVDGVL